MPGWSSSSLFAATSWLHALMLLIIINMIFYRFVLTFRIFVFCSNRLMVQIMPTICARWRFLRWKLGSRGLQRLSGEAIQWVCANFLWTNWSYWISFCYLPRALLALLRYNDLLSPCLGAAAIASRTITYIDEFQTVVFEPRGGEKTRVGLLSSVAKLCLS